MITALPGCNLETLPTIAKQSVQCVVTSPPDLVKPCVMAGSRIGDTILDPFGGSGTTGAVAIELGRQAILCEINPQYREIIKIRTNNTTAAFL